MAMWGVKTPYLFRGDKSMSIRQERVEEQIKELLSELFLRGVSDPRLAGVTVTNVEIDRELRHATIYVNAFDDGREKEVMAGLRHANGYLRRALAPSLQLRIMPELNFRWDISQGHSMRINALLDELEVTDGEEDGA